MSHDEFLIVDADYKALGRQKIYKFPNGYGASIIRTRWSYGHKKGLWELAVITFDDYSWNLCYDTPITDDVIGNLKWNEVEEYLDKIKNLPYFRRRINKRRI